MLFRLPQTSHHLRSRTLYGDNTIISEAFVPIRVNSLSSELVSDESHSSSTSSLSSPPSAVAVSGRDEALTLTGTSTVCSKAGSISELSSGVRNLVLM